MQKASLVYPTAITHGAFRTQYPRKVGLVTRSKSKNCTIRSVVIVVVVVVVVSDTGVEVAVKAPPTIIPLYPPRRPPYIYTQTLEHIARTHSIVSVDRTCRTNEATHLPILNIRHTLDATRSPIRACEHSSRHRRRHTMDDPFPHQTSNPRPHPHKTTISSRSIASRSMAKANCIYGVSMPSPPSHTLHAPSHSNLSPTP